MTFSTKIFRQNSIDETNPIFFQAEYSDLSSKYQKVLSMLQEEKQQREGIEHEFRNRVHQHQAEVESMRTQHELAVRS